jgi:hypothetical protein
MTTKRVLLSAGALVLLLAGALLIAQLTARGDNDRPGTNTSTPNTPSPTESSSPRSEREQVREAYLRQWEVYAEAVRDLNTQELDEVFTGKALDAVQREIRDLRRDGLGVRVRVKHELRIRIADPATVVVVDSYENHSVAFDLDTGKAAERDPNEIIVEAYTLKKVNGAWKVSAISRQSVRPIER